MSSKKKFYILGFSSLILMVLAFFTFTITYCYPTNTNQTIDYNVSLIGENINNNEEIVKVNRNIIDFNYTFSSFDTIKEYNVTLINNGNINALIDTYYLDGLDIVIGQSKQSKETYYLKDYLDVSIKYIEDNKVNSIKKDMEINKNDYIRINSQNKIKFIFRRKNINELSEDALMVLKEYQKDSIIKANLQFKIRILEE